MGLSDDKPESLIDRIEVTPYDSVPPGIPIIPFYDHSVHLKLANEAALAVGRHGGDDLFMLVDSHTATQLHALDDLRTVARRVLVFGGVPRLWTNTENVAGRRAAGVSRELDHVLILISSNISIAVLGSPDTVEHNDDAPFTGGWTMQRSYVEHAVRALLGGEGERLLSGMAAPEEGSAQVSSISMRLMALHASALALRQQDMAMEKSDLASVLDILKAISAKRRAHDILFVFVERVAKVVPSDRCSVVRVWGTARHGQVMASHEDERVTDRQINLSKYPELLKAMTTHNRVVVSDVRADPLTTEIADVLADANIHSILVIPIVLFDENIGSLFLRAVRSRGNFSLREISFFEIVSRAASNALERAQLFESIQIANESLERLAITDGLTGLYNHRYFRDRLEQELERALRYRLPLSCLILDVDNFKQCNDSYGHLLGDAILKEIAERMEACIRRSDICARYGGEEFVVIMPQTGLDGAMIEAERIRQNVAAKPFEDMAEDVRVTVSVGVGVLDFECMLVCEDLLREADQALYRAKRAGKNRVAGPEDKES